jgi:plastocyanin
MHAALLGLFLLFNAPAIDVIGDDGADQYVGSGGLLLPGMFSVETRDSVARCASCRWRLRDPCGPDTGCLISPMPCPPEHRVLETLWSRDGGNTWQAIGAWCVGPGGPRTVAQVGQAASDQFLADVEPPRLAVQPTAGAVTQVPTIWHSGQVAPTDPLVFQVLGAQVALTAVPRWVWEFGDGHALRTSSAGSRHPDRSVSHTFRRPGRYRVSCTTTWTATFTVDGLGPFPVAQDIEQRSAHTITVREARARLIR